MRPLNLTLTRQLRATKTTAHLRASIINQRTHIPSSHPPPLFIAPCKVYFLLDGCHPSNIIYQKNQTHTIMFFLIALSTFSGRTDLTLCFLAKNIDQKFKPSKKDRKEIIEKQKYQRLWPTCDDQQKINRVLLEQIESRKSRPIYH